MQIAISIEGRTPLLMHAFTDEAAQAATAGTRTTSKDNGTPQEQADRVIYRSEQDGKIIIPQPNLFRCILDAGKFHKVGRSKVTTQKSSLIPAALMLNEVEYPLKHQQPWRVDTRAVRIPATGGRILRHRACFDDWQVDFEAELDTDVIPEKLFRLIVNDAGSKIGLGDFRPDTKGPYGKFDVVHWKAKGANGRMRKKA